MCVFLPYPFSMASQENGQHGQDDGQRDACGDCARGRGGALRRAGGVLRAELVPLLPIITLHISSHRGSTGAFWIEGTGLYLGNFFVFCLSCNWRRAGSRTRVCPCPTGARVPRLSCKRIRSSTFIRILVDSMLVHSTACVLGDDHVGGRP